MWRGHCEEKDQPLHPVGEGGCYPDWALLGVWGQTQLVPPALLRVLTELLRVRGTQESQFSHFSTFTSSQYSTGGCWWTPRVASPLLPAPKGPSGGGPWVLPPPKVWWLLCPLWSRIWCPCSPHSWDSSSTMRCQDACGVLPSPIKARDGGQLGTLSSTLAQPQAGDLFLSLLPGDRYPGGDTGGGTTSGTGPEHGPMQGWWPAPL